MHCLGLSEEFHVRRHMYAYMYNMPAFTEVVYMAAVAVAGGHVYRGDQFGGYVVRFSNRGHHIHSSGADTVWCNIEIYAAKCILYSCSVGRVL